MHNAKEDHVFSESSPSSQAVRELLATAPEDDADLSPCTVQAGNCPLASGIEHVFVFETACRALEAVKEVIPAALYHHVMYSPWINIEPKCGFDLSIGHFERPNRLRLMHKIITCSAAGAKWCDEDWSWNSRDEDRNRLHMEKLLLTHKRNPIYQPYIALHVCYCIHEYRRMGKTGSHNRHIPGFEDPRRTAIVDLSPVASLDKVRERILTEELSVAVRNDLQAGKPIATLVGARQGEPTTLKVMDIPGFLTEVKKAVTKEF
jgi:hypothetical protein